MKRILLFAFTFLAVNSIQAQQDKQFTHYMFDKMSYNPATTGFRGYCGTLIYRNQWDRVERAPNTTTFNAQANIPQYNLGVGLSFTNDAIGFMRTNTVGLNGAFHYPTTYGMLSAGLSLGIINVGFNPTWIPPTNTADANLPGALAGTGFDMNFGLYFHGNEGYYVGLSSTHLAPPTLTAINFNTRRHYYVIAGYDFPLSDYTGMTNKLILKPNVLVKADGSTATFDFNLMADFWLNNASYIWGGFSYRLRDAIPLMIGYAFSPKADVSKDMLKFGYSFDIMTNPLNQYGKGTHELMLNYCMFPPPPIIPRHGNPFILQ